MKVCQIHTQNHPGKYYACISIFKSGKSLEYVQGETEVNNALDLLIIKKNPLSD